MTFDREELLSILSDARPALGTVPVIPELSHFWFDKKYLYAYDGGLGVRLAFKTELDCGIPGKTLLDLLRTSTQKEVFLDDVDDTVILQMGKAKVSIAMLNGERRTWPFPDSIPKKTIGSIVLSEAMVEAFNKVLFVRASKPSKAVNHGITIIPKKKDIEIYTTDDNSIAQAIVDEVPPAGLKKFVAPWGFVDRILELVEPGATLHILPDCLMVENKEVLICSNLLELPDNPDLPKTIADSLNDNDPINLPVGLQPILARATILAGQDDAKLNLSVKGNNLQLKGRYALGSLDEQVALKTKGDGTGVFTAGLINRALPYVDSFVISDRALALYGEGNFLYLLAHCK